MIDDALIQTLHNKGIIDKRHLFWWQLGFEGRQVLSEEQFKDGLREISYWARDPREKDNKPFKLNQKIYVKDDVPILIKNLKIYGIKMPCFITCCPMSHERGWRTLESAIESQLPPNQIGLVYHHPHIRGIAVETTKDFLFWYPFYFSNQPDYYTSSAIHFDKLDTWLIVDPVHPFKFCTNLIKREWHKGKRPQQKPQEFNYSSIGLEFKQVPYFEFNPTQPHITIYPLPIFEDNSSRYVKALLKQNPNCSPQTARSFIDSYPHLFNIRKRLDLPVILKSLENGKVDILGVGYLTEESAYYWKLSHQQCSLAKTALKKRLGLES